MSLTAAIIRNLTEEDADRIAKALIRRAKKNDHSFEKLADRTDGKPIQAVEHTGSDGAPVRFTISIENGNANADG